MSEGGGRVEWPVEDLEAWVAALQRERDAAVAENEQLRARIQELERQLRAHQNPHTPPSRRRMRARAPARESPGKRGAPVGHRGATREPGAPDEVAQVRVPCCPECKRESGEPTKVEVRTITDIPIPKPPKVTRFELAHYQCGGCGHQYEAKHPDCPRVGLFGITTLVLVALLKYHLRGPLRRVQAHLEHHHGLKVSVKGVHDLLERVAVTCEEEYEQVKARIRAAPWVHVDETSTRVNGERRWLWVFRTPADDVLVVIRPSRSGDVATEILGEDFDRPVVVDGWSGYKRFRQRQRCWAHLIRELKDQATRSDEAKALYESARALYHDLKEVHEQTLTPEERARHKQEFDTRLADIIDEFSAFDDLDKSLGYLINGMGDWFTCLLHPGMDPTNNPAEQAIREHVIVRRLIGTFRSENGADNYQYLASLLAGWTLQGRNPFNELERLLRERLCLA